MSQYSRYAMPVQLHWQRVPLSEVLEREAQAQQQDLGVQSLLRNALELKVRRNQVRAEVLLHRKQKQVDVPIQEPAMYLPKDEYEVLECNITDQPLPSLPPRTAPVKYIPTNIRTKKRLPKYLTQDGDMVSGSLEEIGDRVYCRPTQGIKPVQPAFLTHHDPELANEEQPAPINQAPRWQPLSCSAALENVGTYVVPVKVFSPHKGHGKYSMWKPLSSHTCTVP